ncbi:hypothetical protein [Rhodospira trueperi]|uniref:Uncharacterized protein n=1 Tax=Rhodospira trueperi TaxID=69960 RepID=A0A1G7BHF3_9PROT|nr:hypothetical protein [Rhodospira trueperi]SDE25655.1 hypothetical protein SAMN05421720_1058 [Rhodospira trueperi]
MRHEPCSERARAASCGDFAAWLAEREAEFERLLEDLMDDEPVARKAPDDAA